MTPAEVGLTCVMALALLLAGAAWHDIRHRRIPNAIVFSGAALGILLNTAVPAGLGFLSPLPGGLGFLDAIYGVGLGLAVMLPFYLLRMMGAGDVKLVTMVGAFLGPTGLMGAILGTFVAGGILALAYAVKHHVALRMLKNLRAMLYSSAAKVYAGGMPTSDDMPESVGHLPYGVAVAVGTLGYLLVEASRLPWARALVG
jgi:prepilin peptidase CpaA